MRTLDELLTRWQAAEVARDAAALDALLDPDFLGDGPAGGVLDKQQWLDRCRLDRPGWVPFAFSALATPVDPQVAIVVGTPSTSRARGDGAVRCVVVAVRRNRRWRIVNVQLGFGGFGHLADVLAPSPRDAQVVRESSEEAQMRTIIESTFVTLDGVISDPEKWGPPYWDDEHSAYASELIARSDALLLGRETYEGFAEVWPTMSNEYADRMNAMPKHVASRTLTETTWNATVITGDVAEEIAGIRQRPGQDILKFGTGELDRTLLTHNLLDELHLWIFPVVAGGGTRLLDGVDVTHLNLVDTTTFRSGIVVNVYQPNK